jgi:hypothetical protein
VKIGAENKKKVITMAVLLAIALPLIVYSYKSMFGGSSAGSLPSSRAAAPKPGKTGLSASAPDPSDDPRLRTDILDYSRSVKYEPGRDIFHMKALPTPTPIAAVRQPTPPPAPPTPTPPPPIPVKYYGFASKPGEPRKVFLQSGERVFVVGQGEIVDRRYRLIQIQPNSVTMEDVLTNNRQPIPLTPR